MSYYPIPSHCTGHWQHSSSLSCLRLWATSVRLSLFRLLVRYLLAAFLMQNNEGLTVTFGPNKPKI